MDEKKNLLAKFFKKRTNHKRGDIKKNIFKKVFKSVFKKCL